MESLKASRAEENNLKGLEYLQRGDAAAAQASFNRAIFLAPNEPSYYLHRAEAHLALGDFNAAIFNLRKVCQMIRNPRFAPSRLSTVYFTQGQIYLDKHAYADALTKFERAWKLNKHNGEILIRMMMAYVGLKKYPEAMKYIDVLIRMNPTNPDFLILRAKLNNLEKNYVGVYTDLQQVISIYPEHLEIPHLRSIVAEASHQYKEEANDSAAHGNYHRSIELLTKSLEIFPQDATARLKRGILRRQIHDYGNAVLDFKSLLDEYGEDRFPEAHRQLCLTFNDMGVLRHQDNDFQHAIIFFNAAIEGDPTDHLFYRNRAECYLSMKDLSKASDDLHQVMLLAGLSATERESVLAKIASIYCQIGIHLFEEGKYVDAGLEFTHAILHDMMIADYWFYRARSYFFNKQIDQARDDLIAALLVKIDHEDSRSLLSHACGGDEELASRLVLEAAGRIICDDKISMLEKLASYRKIPTHHNIFRGDHLRQEEQEPEIVAKGTMSGSNDNAVAESISSSNRVISSSSQSPSPSSRHEQSQSQPQTVSSSSSSSSSSPIPSSLSSASVPFTPISKGDISSRNDMVIGICHGIFETAFSLSKTQSGGEAEPTGVAAAARNYGQLQERSLPPLILRKRGNNVGEQIPVRNSLDLKRERAMIRARQQANEEIIKFYSQSLDLSERRKELYS